MSSRAPIANAVRLLLYVPVPWVFVLTYLVGVGVELAARHQGPVDAHPNVAVASMRTLEVLTLRVSMRYATSAFSERSDRFRSQNDSAQRGDRRLVADSSAVIGQP